MKHRIVFGTFTLIVAVSLFSCSDDKKTSNTETTTPVTATATESPATSKSTTAGAVHSTEQKLYDFASVYMGKIETAIAEPDDDKAIELLNAINTDMKAQAESLKPELESWVKSLSKEETKAFGERMMQRPSTAKAFQMLGDPKLNKRLEKSPKFRDAFEKANAGPSEIWQLGDSYTASEE
jgi:hypothetical protein